MDILMVFEDTIRLELETSKFYKIAELYEKDSDCQAVFNLLGKGSDIHAWQIEEKYKHVKRILGREDKIKDDVIMPLLSFLKDIFPEIKDFEKECLDVNKIIDTFSTKTYRKREIDNRSLAILKKGIAVEKHLSKLYKGLSERHKLTEDIINKKDFKISSFFKRLSKDEEDHQEILMHYAKLLGVLNE